MPRIAAVIEDQIRGELVKVKLSVDRPVAVLIEGLVELFGLPRRDFDLSQIEYRLVRALDKKTLASEVTLSQMGISEGELLQLICPDGLRVWREVQEILEEIESEIIDSVTGEFKDKAVEEVWDRVTRKLEEIEKTQTGGDRVRRLREWVDEVGGPTRLTDIIDDAGDVTGPPVGSPRRLLRWVLTVAAVVGTALVVLRLIFPPQPEVTPIVAETVEVTRTVEVPITVEPTEEPSSPVGGSIAFRGDPLAAPQVQRAVLAAVEWRRALEDVLEPEQSLTTVVDGEPINVLIEVVYDPNEAQAQLDQAGYPIDGPGPFRFSVQLKYYATDSDIADAANEVAADLDNIGIATTIVPVTTDELESLSPGISGGPLLALVAATPATKTPTFTPKPTLTSTSTSLPTATVTPSPPSCVVTPPLDWQSYTVKRGDTLFSLASNTGTTVADIQRINCLPDDRIYTGQQLWLPPFPEPTDTPTITPSPTISPTPTPTASLTPTPTWTPSPTPMGSPDLIVQDISSISVSCPGGSGTCVTEVNFIVANVGIGSAGAFNIRIVADPSQSVIVDQPSSGLASGETQTFTIMTTPGGNCFDSDCTVCITVDNNQVITESDEENNMLCETRLG